MIKILIPTHYWLITLIGFSIVIMLSGFSYKRIAKNNHGVIASSNFYDLKAITIDGQEILFSQFKGKKVYEIEDDKKNDED